MKTTPCPTCGAPTATITHPRNGQERTIDAAEEEAFVLSCAGHIATVKCHRSHRCATLTAAAPASPPEKTP